MKIGICVKIEKDLEEQLVWAREAGFDNCQLQNYDMSLHTDEYAQYVKDLLEKYEIEATAYWCGWHGPIKWNFHEGPATLGLVPPEYRSTRTQNLLDGAAFARKLGLSNIITHLGFLPVDCNDPKYIGVVNAVKYIIEELEKYDQYFYMETGQEPPVVLKRLIEDVGSDRLFINLDPANLMLYGNGDPVGSLDVIGPYVKSMHAKDGSYPRGGYELGKEYPLGKGDVNIPELIKKLKEIGFDGPISIENELDVNLETKRELMIEAKHYLEELWNK